MTVMGDFTEFEVLKDQQGYVWGGGANSARWNAEYLLARLIHNRLPHEERSRLRELFFKLEHKPGLLTRYPGNTNHRVDSIDNIASAFFADFILDTGFCKRWLEYGRTQGSTKLWSKADRLSKTVFKIIRFLGFKKIPYVYNNLDEENGFEVSSWYFRYPHAIPMAKAIAGEKLNTYDLLGSVVMLLLSWYQHCFKKQTGIIDGAILMSFWCFTMRNTNRFLDFLINFYVGGLKNRFPTGMGEATYFDAVKRYLTNWWP